MNKPLPAPGRALGAPQLPSPGALRADDICKALAAALRRAAALKGTPLSLTAKELQMSHGGPDPVAAVGAAQFHLGYVRRLLGPHLGLAFSRRRFWLLGAGLDARGMGEIGAALAVTMFFGHLRRDGVPQVPLELAELEASKAYAALLRHISGRPLSEQELLVAALRDGVHRGYEEACVRWRKADRSEG